VTHSIHKFSVQPRPGSADPLSDALRRSLGRDDVRCWHDYYIEFPRELAAGEAEAICGVLGGGPGVEVVFDEPLGPAGIQVAHRIGVVDNESPSLVALCDMLGVPAVAGKVATTYTSPSAEALHAVQEQVFNPVIEDLHLAEPTYTTLVPSGHYEPAATFDLLDRDDAALVALGRADGRNLSRVQMQHIQGLQKELGLDSVTDVLLEALDARWSDHCSHTTWRSHGNLLGRLVEASRATQNPNVVSMFHDNAGVWDFYDGWSLVIKAETHNGPSAISAYFGQLTKLGGVLRDILGTGLGADPVGCYEYTATGLPEGPSPIAGKPSPKQIAVETIRAIKEYGNTFGVPMMRSRMSFHPAYRAKPFALGGSIGVVPTAQARRGRPQPGDMLVLVGGLTGSEGIHGASASSAGSTMDNTAVQIGAPLEQVKFRKAIIDLRDAGCLRALTDVGGAGLNSAVGEIGEACGVWLNTALVPLKTSALPMWRILLSESQERMILVVPPEQLAAAREITERHQVRTTVVGRFTGTGRYGVFHQPALTEADVVALPPGAVPDDLGELGFDVPYDRLDSEPSPVDVGPPPAVTGAPGAWPEPDPRELAGLVARVAADTEVASQLFADEQYDSTVQGHTLYGPHYGHRRRVPTSYWAGRPVPGSAGAAVLATAFDPWLFEAHPVRALRQQFCELLGTMVLAGVDRADVCLCDNFYTPHLADHAGAWLVAMVDELAALVRRFGTPVISGKDSSAGSVATDEGLVHVPPAVFLTALGKVPAAGALLPEAWSRAGDVLVRIGPSCPSPDVTVAGRALGLTGSVVDDVDVEGFAGYLEALAAQRALLVSGSPVAAGGVAARLVRGALATGLGADLVPAMGAAELFAEHRGGALVQVRPDDVPRLPAALHPTVVGTLTEAPGIRVGGVDLLAGDVEKHWLGSFEERIA
jgi:phosphoribosylformylglycinamidine synthase